MRRRLCDQARPRWLARLLCMLTLLLAAQAVQAATYSFRSDTYAWETAANAITWDRLCTGYPGDDDQATITFSGGFTFRFAGVDYGSVRVLTNGALQFGADTGFFRHYANTNLPAGVATPTRAGCVSAANTRTMMVYWTDLDPSRAGSGGVTWQQKGTAPNRYVVVSWNGVYQYNTSTPYTFQVILFENGSFQYQFGNANATGANATIGVQIDSSDYTLYGYNSGYNANGTAILWTLGSTAPVRLAAYRFDENAYSGLVGEVIDSSGNGQHAVRVGSANTSATAVVCRSVQIAANTSAAQNAIDTLLDVDNTIGSQGSVSLWYRSDLAWNGGTAALLFDATTVANRPLFLMRAGDGRLVLSASDSSGTILTATTATRSTAANTWVHLAATWRFLPGVNQTTLRVYVNGALAATTSGTSTGALHTSLASLFLGDNRSSVTPSGGTLNSAAGFLDEARLYNYEIGLAEISLDQSATHPCVPPVDHYELSAPASSLSCIGATLTVTACSTAGRPCASPMTTMAGQSVTLSTSAGTLAPATVVLDATGRGTASLQNPGAADGSSVTVTLGSLPVPPSAGTYCCTDGISCSAANSCSTTFNTAGFLIASTTGGAPITIPAQTAGTASGSLFLRAVRTSTSTQACEAALTGAQTVNWAYECVNPAACSGSNLMSVNGGSATTVQRNNSGSVGSYTSVPMTFDANGNAPFTFNFSDAGQTRLWAAKTVNSAPLAGSSNAFVTRPAGFTLSNIGQSAAPNLANPGAASAAGAAFVRAGESFSATVTAVTSGGAATPNYGRETAPEGVLLTRSLVLPAAGATGTLSNATIGGASFAAGVATVSNLAFSEVGIITLTPSVADGDYLGAGNVSGAASANIGRFFPARFALGAPALTTRPALACTPASSFNYLGENFGLAFTLTAQNLAGATTQNYAGAFARLDPGVATSLNLAGRDGTTVFSTGSGRLSLGSAGGSWTSGVASVSLSAAALRAAAPDGPFSAAFGVAPQDSDGVALAAFDLSVTVPYTVNDRATLGTLALRFGRLVMFNAIGAADRVLALPVAAQFWNGSAFADNTQDSCTTVPASAVSFGNLRRTLTTADTAVATPISIANGRGSLRLAAPTGGRSGSADLALSLGSTATDASCLQPWTPGAGDAATAGANLPYLRGAWCTATYDKDPAARATFGQQRGFEALVYRRENY